MADQETLGKPTPLLARLVTRYGVPDGLAELLRASGHWNGYRREEAVLRLGMLGSPVAIPQLIIRSNDWVPQVRNAARQVLRSLAVAANAEAFVLALPELHHLRHCGRDQHGALIEAIEQFLLATENAPHLVAGIRDADGRVARACIGLVIGHGLLPVPQIVELGLSHPDLVVRMQVSRLFRQLTGPGRHGLLLRTARDPFMPIRREALQLLAAEGIDTDFIRAFLFDRHGSVREIAIRALQRRGIDVLRDYLDALAAPTLARRRCAIWALGELRADDQIERVEEAWRSPWPSLRRQALGTLGKLRGDAAAPIVVAAIADRSSSVCGEAARWCRRLGLRFSADQLLGLIDTAGQQHTAATCLVIAKSINKWERLIFLMTLLGPKYREQGIAVAPVEIAIRCWNHEFNRSSSQPSAMQVERVRQLYSANAGPLTDRIGKSFVFTLEAYLPTT